MRRVLIVTMVAAFLFSLQNAGTVYINSSFASLFINEQLVGLLYTIAACLALVGTHALPRIITPKSARSLLLYVLLATVVILLGLSTVTSPILFAVLFVLYFAANTFSYYCFDILIEALTTTAIAGRIRGAFLTAMNIGYMLAPLGSGIIVQHFSYRSLYAIVAIVLVAVCALIITTPKVTGTRTEPRESLSVYRTFFKNRNLRGVFITNFLLQFFYAWMVIYTPIYLHEQLHISWQTLGLIFSITLSAFVFLQYPFGRLADLVLGEKELMVGGLLVAGIATPLLVIADGFTSIFILALILFATRIGASAIEVASESYFFKHIKANQTRSLSIFRSTSSLAYIIAPLLASVILENHSITTLFFVLAGIMCIGIIAPLSVKDTR